MICSGFGHSNCPNVETALEQTIKQAINLGCDEFYCGLKGGFDSQFATIVLNEKKNNPKIKVYYVSPYVLTKSSESTDCSNYDGIIVPELENVPYRFKIIRRNEWIVNKSDYIIFYVDHNFGGAYQMYEFATKKKKRIINLVNNIPEF